MTNLPFLIIEAIMITTTCGLVTLMTTWFIMAIKERNIYIMVFYLSSLILICANFYFHDYSIEVIYHGESQ